MSPVLAGRKAKFRMAPTNRFRKEIAVAEPEIIDFIPILGAQHQLQYYAHF